MSTPNFTDILSKKAVETEEPKPLPPGTYLAAVQSLPEQREVKQRDGAERKTLRIKCKLLMAQADVDQDKLAEVGDLSSMPPQNYDLWIDTPQGEWSLRRFLADTLGLELADKSYSELLPESVGRQLLVTLKHTMGTRDNVPVIYVNIDSVAHV